MSIFLKIAAGILAVAYPVAIFFGLQYFEPKYLALFLAAILLLRFLSSGRKSDSVSKKQVLILSVIGSLIVLFTWYSNSTSGLKLYPVLINAAFLSVFLMSLFYPPTVVERLARLKEPNLPASGVIYTRKVTIVWCTFFLINGAIALYTALFSSMKIWTLYNGLLAYIAMGCLMGGEFLYRKIALGK